MFFDTPLFENNSQIIILIDNKIQELRVLNFSVKNYRRYLELKNLKII